MSLAGRRWLSPQGREAQRRALPRRLREQACRMRSHRCDGRRNHLPHSRLEETCRRGRRHAERHARAVRSVTWRRNPRRITSGCRRHRDSDRPCRSRPHGERSRWTWAPSLDGPAAIVTPTSASIPPALKTTLKSSGHAVYALSEIAGVDERHRLAGLQSAETLLAPLREKLLGGETSAALGRIWVLPPNARWEDLTFEFTAEEVVNVRFGPQTRRFEPEQFGMKSKKNGRPTMLWTLLRSMARLAGSLTWNDSQASTKIKKQKQLLSTRLMHLFGLPGDLGHGGGSR